MNTNAIYEDCGPARSRLTRRTRERRFELWMLECLHRMTGRQIDEQGVAHEPGVAVSCAYCAKLHEDELRACAAEKQRRAEEHARRQEKDARAAKIEAMLRHAALAEAGAL